MNFHQWQNDLNLFPETWDSNQIYYAIYHAIYYAIYYAIHYAIYYAIYPANHYAIHHVIYSPFVPTLANARIFLRKR